MGHHAYRVYVAQTDAASEELEFLGFDGLDFFDEVIVEIACRVVYDVHDSMIEDYYVDIIGSLCVSYFARAMGSEIYINIYFIEGDGDWDPDDGAGLNHLAHAPVENVAKGFTNLIGGQVVFRWIKPQRRSSSARAVTQADLTKVFSDSSMVTSREQPIETQNVELASPSIYNGGTIQRFGIAEMNEFPPLDMEMPFSACEYSLYNQAKAEWRQNSKPVFMHDLFDALERREKMARNAYSASSIEMPLGCSLPPRINSMVHLNLMVHGQNFPWPYGLSCPVPDHGNPGAN